MTISKDELIQIRISKENKEKWKVEAKKQGKSLSQFVIDTINDRQNFNYIVDEIEKRIKNLLDTKNN